MLYCNVSFTQYNSPHIKACHRNAVNLKRLRLNMHYITLETEYLKHGSLIIK